MISYLKRVRFSTAVLFTLSIGVELLTPAFPKYFLLLASIANIAKQISLACLLATGVRILYPKKKKNYCFTITSTVISLDLFYTLSKYFCYINIYGRECFLVKLNFSTLLQVLMLSLYKQSAVHRSFAIADNLGEVSAKAQVNYMGFSSIYCLC